MAEPRIGRTRLEAGATSDVARRLVEQAARLFARNGYSMTSIDDIAAAAKVTKGAMYYYFSSKDDLLFSIYEQVITAELDGLTSVLAKNLAPEEALRELIADVCRTTAQNRDNVAIFVREMHLLSLPKISVLRASRNRYHVAFRDLISAGMGQGTFDPDVDAELATIAFFGLLHHYYIWYEQGKRPFDDEAFSAMSTDWFLRSLRR